MHAVLFGEIGQEHSPLDVHAAACYLALCCGRPPHCELPRLEALKREESCLQSELETDCMLAMRSRTYAWL